MIKSIKKLMPIALCLVTFLGLSGVQTLRAPKYNSHASEANTFALSKQETTKQFSATGEGDITHSGDDDGPVTHGDGTELSTLTKKANNKMDDYMCRIRNLSHYTPHFSQMNDVDNLGSTNPQVVISVHFVKNNNTNNR